MRTLMHGLVLAWCAGVATAVAAPQPVAQQPQPAAPVAAAPAKVVAPAAVQGVPGAAPVASDKAQPAVAEDAVSPVPDSTEDLPATLRENSYFYQSFGTTDPFRSLLAGDFEPKLQELVDLHTVQMVGVVWANDEIAAMVQDAQGFGYTLRPGDAVKNGSVVSITQDALTARLNIFGQTTQVTLRLQDAE